ncbi:MAG: T9SS type A sorting domain-containing protein [Bacteroidota bacterium]|nr:T9SS type A sorting domain-containing protein [Bacteroidota bacterium]
MNKKLLTLFFSLLFFIFTLQVEAQSYKRICVIGSSTAWGYFGSANPSLGLYPRDSAWTFKLSKYYQNLGQIDTLFNIASVGTDPYTGMPSSFTPPAQRNQPDGRYNITRAVKLVPKPDVIIVNYPSNNFDWQTTQEILFCLQTIKDSANAAGIQCYITTTQPRNTFSTSERQKLQDLRDLILNRFGTYAIDFFTPIVEIPSLDILPQYSLGDGIHTNPAGQTVLEQQVIAKDVLLNTLAVNFFNVNGVNENAKSKISWSIPADRNVTQFIIERSADAIDFREVGRVNPVKSTLVQKYEFVDGQPINSINYYRVAAMETGSQKTYSRVIAVMQFRQALQVGRPFPIPARNVISVKIFSANPQKVTFSILDIEGRLMRKETKFVQAEFTYSAGVAELPTGKYTLVIQADSQKEILQFIK